MIHFMLRYRRVGFPPIECKVPYSKMEHTLAKFKEKEREFMEVTIHEFPLKRNKPRPVIWQRKYVYEKIDRDVVVSFSGGKDSTAMLIRMLELGERVDKIIFADTLYEFPEMYEYIDKVETYIQQRFDKNLEVTRLKPKTTVIEWAKGKATSGKHKGKERGFPLTGIGCYWRNIGKLQQLNKAQEGCIVNIGIAIDEKERAVEDPEFKLTRYPLIEWGWTEEDCMNYLKKLDLVNPLYSEGRNRTGCWWCPQQGLDSLRLLYTTRPKEWAQLEEWESELERQIFMRYTVEELSSKFAKEGLKKGE